MKIWPELRNWQLTFFSISVRFDFIRLMYATFSVTVSLDQIFLATLVFNFTSIPFITL